MKGHSIVSREALKRFVVGSPRKAAQPPGTLLYTGRRAAEPVRYQLIDFDGENLVSRDIVDISEVFSCRDSQTTSWINVDGLHDTKALEQIGEQFGIHPLVLEDVANTNQRPKLEDHDTYLYIVLRMLTIATDNTIQSEQVSFILGSNFLISFQESPGDVFGPVRERIEQGRPRIRGGGPDYLLYALLDAIVDNYGIVLEHLGAEIEDLDEAITTHPRERQLNELHGFRRELVYLARRILPVRELVGGLGKTEGTLVSKKTRLFLSDVQDHVQQAVDLVEMLREVVASLHDLYHAGVGSRLNEVMKVLTIIATLFVPVTFIAGVYGMNFEFMPELDWKYAYPVFWAVVAVVMVVMVSFFRRRGWF